MLSPAAHDEFKGTKSYMREGRNRNFGLVHARRNKSKGLELRREAARGQAGRWQSGRNELSPYLDENLSQ
ncbi:hypothetical protein ARTHRO9AX_190146 [Arthrobacter sp. 9AX]|nr:hypothetical protein ARTHRO9AX_190146 [Arthrobacter sp. 9AX]